jgi:hypothetical protein
MIRKFCNVVAALHYDSGADHRQIIKNVTEPHQKPCLYSTGSYMCAYMIFRSRCTATDTGTGAY